jgi:hypothetical protein
MPSFFAACTHEALTVFTFDPRLRGPGPAAPRVGRPDNSEAPMPSFFAACTHEASSVSYAGELSLTHAHARARLLVLTSTTPTTT